MENNDEKIIARGYIEEKQLGIVKHESLDFCIKNNDQERVYIHGEHSIQGLGYSNNINSDWHIKRVDLFHKLSEFLRGYYTIEIDKLKLERQLINNCSDIYNINLSDKETNNVEKSLMVNEKIALDYLKKSLEGIMKNGKS